MLRLIVVATLLAAPALLTACKGDDADDGGSATSTATARPSGASSTASRTPSPGPTAAPTPTEAPQFAIVTPQDGETISLPAAIEYRISGIDVASGVHMHAFVSDLDEPFVLEMTLSGQSGTAQLPADKRLTGVRDITFQLAAADHSPLPATVVVQELTIEGPR